MSSVPKHPIFVCTIAFSKGALFTVERKCEPYQGFYQLPEGSVKRGETLEQAAHRVLLKASGLSATKLKLISVFDDVATGERRIPNTRSFIISFVALQWTGIPPLENCRWISDWRNQQLAFEHGDAVLEADSVLETACMSRTLYAVR